MTEKIEFTLENARAMAQKAIDLKGEDFVYRREYSYSDCKYMHEVKAWNEDTGRYEGTGEMVPGCIWGHALSMAGVPDEEIDQFEGSSIKDALYHLWVVSLVDHIDLQASAWANAVQGLQDSGETWGTAVRKADKMLEDAILRFPDDVAQQADHIAATWWDAY